MKVFQIANPGQDCGISIFAEKLQAHLGRTGVDVVTCQRLPQEVRDGVVLLQYHDELFSIEEVASLRESCKAAIILLAHSEVPAQLHGLVDGFAAMCPGMIGAAGKPVHEFPHPAWTPQVLEDRIQLRREFGLPENRRIAGTNGYLKFERQFAEIVEAILPEARRNEWFVELITSPWRLPSPGLIPRLQKLQNQHPDHFRFQHAFLGTETLNRRLQACDLLWCWTAASSSSYASGVISDQYASGTRVIAANKQQHAHVLVLPNVVTGPEELDAFVARLVEELHNGPHPRHDPGPVSWDKSVAEFEVFLRNAAAQAAAGNLH